MDVANGIKAYRDIVQDYNRLVLGQTDSASDLPGPLPIPFEPDAPDPQSIEQQGGIPTFTVDGTITRQIAANDDYAIRVDNRPALLTRTTNQSQIRSNRYYACKDIKAVMGSVPGQSCDEYPFASTYESEYGATTRYVQNTEQFVQGGQLSAFYRTQGIGDGSPFNVVVINVTDP